MGRLRGGSTASNVEIAIIHNPSQTYTLCPSFPALGHAGCLSESSMRTTAQDGTSRSRACLVSSRHCLSNQCRCGPYGLSRIIPPPHHTPPLVLHAKQARGAVTSRRSPPIPSLSLPLQFATPKIPLVARLPPIQPRRSTVSQSTVDASHLLDASRRQAARDPRPPAPIGHAAAQGLPPRGDGNSTLHTCTCTCTCTVCYVPA